MATSTDIVSGALRHIGVRAAESPLTAAEIQDGMEDLNDMGNEWEESGIHLGFTSSIDANATLDIPASSLAAFKANLAIRLAPSYGRIITPALANLANISLNALVKSTAFIGDVEFPDTLPRGSGNECPELLNNRFFTENSIENF
jgi:hypothetical protein